MGRLACCLSRYSNSRSGSRKLGRRVELIVTIIIIVVVQTERRKAVLRSCRSLLGPRGWLGGLGGLGGLGLRDNRLGLNCQGLVRGFQGLGALIEIPVDFASLVLAVGLSARPVPRHPRACHSRAAHHTGPRKHGIVNRVGLDVAAVAHKLDLDDDQVVNVLEVITYGGLGLVRVTTPNHEIPRGPLGNLTSDVASKMVVPLSPLDVELQARWVSAPIIRLQAWFTYAFVVDVQIVSSCVLVETGGVVLKQEGNIGDALVCADVDVEDQTASDNIHYVFVLGAIRKPTQKHRSITNTRISGSADLLMLLLEERLDRVNWLGHETIRGIGRRQMVIEDIHVSPPLLVDVAAERAACQATAISMALACAVSIAVVRGAFLVVQVEFRMEGARAGGWACTITATAMDLGHMAVAVLGGRFMRLGVPTQKLGRVSCRWIPGEDGPNWVECTYCNGVLADAAVHQISLEVGILACHRDQGLVIGARDQGGRWSRLSPSRCREIVGMLQTRLVLEACLTRRALRLMGPNSQHWL